MHSESHWQNEGTYIEFLEKTVKVDMEATIAKLGLKTDQKVRMCIYFDRY